MTNNTSIYTYTENKLTALFQNDEAFLEKFAQMNMYYQSKFTKIVPEEKKEKFFDSLFQAVKSQFFNGYYLFRELLSHEGSNFEDSWFLQPEGYITQDIPQLLRDAIGDENFQDVVETDVMQKLMEWAIVEFEDVYNNLSQVAFDVVCLGALQSIWDERHLRGLTIEKGETGLLFPLQDLTFVTPQHFFTCHYKTYDTEKWNVFYWSTLENKDVKAGEVIISEIPNQEGDKVYFANVYLLNELEEFDREIILGRIMKTLLEQHDVGKDDVQIHFATVNDFYLSVNDSMN